MRGRLSAFSALLFRAGSNLICFKTPVSLGLILGVGLEWVMMTGISFRSGSNLTTCRTDTLSSKWSLIVELERVMMTGIGWPLLCICVLLEEYAKELKLPIITPLKSQKAISTFLRSDLLVQYMQSSKTGVKTPDWLNQSSSQIANSNCWCKRAKLC